MSIKAASLSVVKQYARKQHISVSKLVQKLFDDIVEQQQKKTLLLERYKNAEVSDDIKYIYFNNG